MKKHFSTVSLRPFETLFNGFLLFLLYYAPRLSSAIVHIRGKNFSFPIIDAPARFAVRVNSSGICGALYVADPIDACSSLQNNVSTKESDEVRFVLIERGECAFEDKVRNAQESGFDAAIVYDNRHKRNLVSIFVSKAASETLKKFAQGEEGECCISPSLEEATWTVLVISCISLLVIVCVLATFFFTRNRRANRQGGHHHSPCLDRKTVEVFPCFTFNSNCSRNRCSGRMCAICLEGYKDGETLRVLPCRHDFHAKCVESWLTKWGTFCPVCKHEMSTAIAGHLSNERTSLLSPLTTVGDSHFMYPCKNSFPGSISSSSDT